MKVYLSPSNQPNNKCVLGHSELEHCEELVQKMLPLLAQKGIEYKVRGEGSLTKHINEATAWGADLYLPIHTNAAGGTARGTRFGFYPGRRDSQDACKVFRDNFKRIYPLPDRVVTTTYTFAEAKSPKCPSVYCETIFHDNKADAEWFHANMDRVARNFVESIAELLGVKELFEVKIELTRQENADFFGVALGTVIAIDMETYLLGVVPAEIGNAPLEACKAQAVAARSFGFVRASAGIIDDTTINQAYRAPRGIDPAYPNAHQAVRDTAGQMLYYNGKVATTYYSHSNGGKVLACHEVWSQNIPYLVTKFDPWTTEPKNGHGVGLSQMGAVRAAEMGIGYKDILAFYYPGTRINNEEVSIPVSYKAIVQTKNPLSLNLWSNINKNQSLKLIPRGDTVEVLEEVNATWAKIQHEGMQGYADRQYLVKVDNPPAPEPIDYTALANELAGIADRLRVIAAALEG